MYNVYECELFLYCFVRVMFPVDDYETLTAHVVYGL